MSETVIVRRPSRLRRWGTSFIKGLVVFLAGLALLTVVIDSQIGRRLVADFIGKVAPASGLRIRIGRIEGSLYGQSVLRDVRLSDSKGVFAEIPEARLDWRPFAWLRTGLDIRELRLLRARLKRLPELRPGDPNQPLLPKYDIRIDRFTVENLRVDKGVLGEARRVDLSGGVRIEQGLANVQLTGSLGGKDRLHALLDAEPAKDKLELKLDYHAPPGGLLAGLTGYEDGLSVALTGAGGWRKWDGALLARQNDARLAAFKLAARDGRFSLIGQANPRGRLHGLAARAVGETLSLSGETTFENRTLDGWLVFDGEGLSGRARGRIDLTENRFDGFAINGLVKNPRLLGPETELRNARFAATLDGPLSEVAVTHSVNADSLSQGDVRLAGLDLRGTAQAGNNAWSIPLKLRAARIVTGNPQFDPRLVNVVGAATLRLVGSQIASDNIALDVPGLAARLTMRGDLARGGYGFAGTAAARGLALENLGTANADAKLVLRVGDRSPWSLRMNLAGRMARVDNATLTSLAGNNLRFAGSVNMAQGQPILIESGRLNGSLLSLAFTGRRGLDGRVKLSGSGRHVEYGPFRVDADVTGSGTSAVLVFADPLPAAGLKNVRVALSPIANGFAIKTAGQSTLGPFDGDLALFSRPGAATRIDVKRLDFGATGVTGAVTLGKGAVSGQLALAGGGIDGTVLLSPRNGGQGFDLALTADNARFAGNEPIVIDSGSLKLTGFIAKDRTTIVGSASGQGIQYGDALLGQATLQANVTNGRGTFTGSLVGRHGARYALNLRGRMAPGQFAAHVRGTYAGRALTMPRYAVLTRERDGWRLARSQVNYAGGTLIASGLIGGRTTELDLAMDKVPLALADLVTSDLGLGGTASGIVAYRAPRGGLPTGSARLQVRGLQRSGLTLTSQPIDLAFAASLGAQALELRGVASSPGVSTNGRVQARISALPASGALGERLRAGRLFAQLRFNGPAEAIWRLVALDVFDLTGPLAIAADATGTLATPVISGTLASDNLRLQSALTGTDVSGIAARGTFSGSRLVITSFAGRTAGGGRVAGSGSIGLTELDQRGPTMDLRMAAQNAQVLARSDMAATVTGPLRVVSDGLSGTIAGRVRIDAARWVLGRAQAVQQLPTIKTAHINRPRDAAPPRAAAATWRYLIDADGDDRVVVRGLGLDSEWAARIRLRGTTQNPAIFGRADVVRGGYEFAGKRFELTRGRIDFDGETPPDPRLNIAAEADEGGITAQVTVTGTALKPDIRFSSNPALPEEELLSRLLFGTSITQISAPEALQLGAALASLRGGSGLDPINKLRDAIGLDRLRIVSPDAATGRGTGIAVGKYLGRRFYAEVVTDGRGYTATQLEFRITRWLSLLAAVSSTGRESINARVSKDY